MEDRASQLGLSLHIETVTRPIEAIELFAEALPVLSVPLPSPVRAGSPEQGAMPTVISSIDAAVEMVKSGEASAVVTNPISKSHLYKAGFKFPGHTEYLAALAEKNGQVPHPVMMLAAGILKVIPTTIHVPLKECARRADLRVARKDDRHHGPRYAAVVRASETSHRRERTEPTRWRRGKSRPRRG